MIVIIITLKLIFIFFILQLPLCIRSLLFIRNFASLLENENINKTVLYFKEIKIRLKVMFLFDP